MAKGVDQIINKRKRMLHIAIAVVVVLVLIFLGVGGYMFMLWKNGDRLNRETMFTVEQKTNVTLTGDEIQQGEAVPVLPEGKATIKHNGKYYTLNEDVISVLFMGIDVHADQQFEDIGVTAHQADTLILLAIDPDENELIFINIPRMTIAEIQQLDPNFNYARTTESPICIQYAFGDGKELSCTLMRDAVSNLMFNIPISRYISMNLDGLYTANDAVGGVTVTILDDMTAFNRRMEKGAEYTLEGEDVEIYLRRRLGEGLDGTNASRSKRHIQYYKAFFKKAKEKLKQDPMFALNLYNSMGSDVQTDLTVEEMIYLSKAALNMDISDGNILTLEGTTKNEDFFVDDAALRNLIIDVFYEEVS